MSDDVKRYRAYLTRLTKWIVFDEANKERQFAVDHIRSVLIKAGELEVYLGDGWAKRVFGDTKMFENDEGSFFNIREGVERAKTKPEWKGGPRPDEDVAGDTLRKLVAHVAHLPGPPWTSYRLANEKWDPISRFCVAALDHMRSRGIERPLTVLQEHAFTEALLTDDRNHQTVGLWLTDTRYYLDVYTRLRAHAKGEGEMYENEMGLFKPTSWPMSFDEETKKLELIEEPFTVEVAMRVVRGVLVKRRLLKEQRRAA